MTTRVLHAISEMGTGGAERLVVELVDGGAARGWHSEVASGGGRHADDLAGRGVVTHPVPVVGRNPWRLWRAVRAVRRALRSADPDVVLAHNVVMTLVVRLAMGRSRRVPLVTVFHGVAPEHYPRAARVLERRSDRVVVVSDAIGRRLRAAGLSGRPVHVIRNAVTVAAPGARAAARRDLDLPPNAPVALCLARMVPQKRHDLLLRAWEKVGGDAVLLLAGDGPLRAGLEAAGHGDRVRFLGVRTDVPRLLAATDITVLTSDWEGLPLVVLESLAASRPVVATDVDGLREVLGDGAGLLVPPGDADAVAEACELLLSHPAERTRLAAAGIALLRRDHDPEDMVRSYDKLIGDAVNGSDSPAPRTAAPPPRRRWLKVGALGALAGIVVAGLVVLGTAAQPERYEGRIGLLALPVLADPTSTSISVSYGEVVSLALPSLTELATTPSVLTATALSVPGSPTTDELAGDVGVELLPGSGVARLTVRAATPELAAQLAEALAATVIRADVLAPAATLQVLDDQATVSQVSPDLQLGAGLALLAGLVAAAAMVALLRPFRPRVGAGDAVLDALARSGRAPVAVLDGADPVLATRILVLQRAADRPLRVLGTGPGLDRRIRSLEAELAQNAAFLGGGDGGANGHGDRSGVVAVVDRRRTRAGDVTSAVGSLPEHAVLLAVVLV